MTYTQHCCRYCRGFTFIEMSLALLLISLIIAGSLYAGDMVRAAKVHAAASDYTRYVTAAKVFKQKYDYLPGDIPPGQAETYGLTGGLCLSGGVSIVPLVDGCNYARWISTGNDILDRNTSETNNFYMHLSRANLIEGDYTTSGYVNGGGNTPALTWAPVEIQPGGAFTPDNFNGENGFTFGADINEYFNGVGYFVDKVVSDDLYGFDRKLDDGYPSRGKISAMTFYRFPYYELTIGLLDTYVDYSNISSQCCSLTTGVPDPGCTTDSVYRLGTNIGACTVEVRW